MDDDQRCIERLTHIERLSNFFYEFVSIDWLKLEWIFVANSASNAFEFIMKMVLSNVLESILNAYLLILHIVH